MSRSKTRLVLSTWAVGMVAYAAFSVITVGLVLQLVSSRWLLDNDWAVSAVGLGSQGAAWAVACWWLRRLEPRSPFWLYLLGVTPLPLVALVLGQKVSQDAGATSAMRLENLAWELVVAAVVLAAGWFVPPRPREDPEPSR